MVDYAGIKEDPAVMGRLCSALERAPEIKGYTAKQLAKLIRVPAYRVKKRLEILRRKGLVEAYKIDEETVYQLSLDGLIDVAIKGAPKVSTEFTAKQIEEITYGLYPWRSGWHLELLPVNPELDGRIKYPLVKKKKSRKR
jgi:hypothetical protein